MKKEIDDDTTISSSSLGDLRMTGWKIDEQDGGCISFLLGRTLLLLSLQLLSFSLQVYYILGGVKIVLLLIVCFLLPFKKIQGFLCVLIFLFKCLYNLSLQFLTHFSPYW